MFNSMVLFVAVSCGVLVHVTIFLLDNFGCNENKFGASRTTPKQNHPYHLVSGSWACVLEASKLSAVMNGDDQLPGSEQHHSHQQDAANHCKQHHHSIWPTTTLWQRRRKISTLLDIEGPIFREVQRLARAALFPSSFKWAKSFFNDVLRAYKSLVRINHVIVLI